MSSNKNSRGKYLEPAVLILSVLGIVLSLYLSYLHFSDTRAALCAAGSECDTVRQSSFSDMLGIPVAVLGSLGYCAIFILTLVSMPKRTKWLTLYIVSLAGFVFSAYLTYVELFVINAICMYCVVSAVLMTVIFIMILKSKSWQHPKLSSLLALGLGVIVAVIVVFGSWTIQSEKFSEAAKTGSGSSAPSGAFETGLAEYLGKTGAVMYGSYKCPHCIEQKKMFGNAFEYVNYVECHPKGENANPSLCFAKGIVHYPTWEIGGRYYEGAMTLERLAELSGYDGSS